MNARYGLRQRYVDLSDRSELFKEEIRWTINYQTPVCLDDIVVLTKGDKTYQTNFFKTLESLREAA